MPKSPTNETTNEFLDDKEVFALTQAAGAQLRRLLGLPPEDPDRGRQIAGRLLGALKEGELLDEVRTSGGVKKFYKVRFRGGEVAEVTLTWARGLDGRPRTARDGKQVVICTDVAEVGGAN